VASQKDLFANFERMRREIDELFGDVFGRTPLSPRRGFSPRVDVYYCGDPPRAIVKAELAGVDIERVGLEIRGRQLILSGTRTTQVQKGALYQQVEIEQGPFRRTVELGADVNAESAQATYDDGILRVEIPIAPDQESGRQVPIRAREEDDS
jgi:HSP20 family protein